MTTTPIPRNPLGEWGYRLLWIGVAALPALVLLLRWSTIEQGLVWSIFFIVGVPALVVAQSVLAMLAWVYRQRQWRHWLGAKSTIASFVYYGLWVLLALAMPDGEPGVIYPSPFQRLVGQDAGEVLSTILLWLVGAAYTATLVGIVVEGERAVATDPSGRTVKSIISSVFER